MKPSDFDPSVEVSGIFCLAENKILLLKRAQQTSQGNLWGLPAGKVEVNEAQEDAAVRELFEETGIVADAAALSYITKIYCRLPKVDYTFHLYQLVLKKLVKISIDSKEHSDFRWLPIAEAYHLPLISGGAFILNCCEKCLQKNARCSPG